MSPDMFSLYNYVFLVTVRMSNKQFLSLWTIIVVTVLNEMPALGRIRTVVNVNVCMFRAQCRRTAWHACGQ